MLSRLFTFFTSLRLTLLLLLALAAATIPGSARPAQPGHYELYFQGFGYRLLLGLLALNLLCCTLKTCRRNLLEESRFLSRARDDSGLPLSCSESAETLAKRLRKAGYRVVCRDGVLLGRRGRFGRWGSTLVHLALLIIMAGALLGETGFVGTLNTYVGNLNTHYLDWHTQLETPLPFALRADSFRPIYYPIELRFELREHSSGRRLAQVQGKVGESFLFPGGELQGIIKSFEPQKKVLSLDVLRQGRRVGEYRVDAMGQTFSGRQLPGIDVVNVEYRDPQLKQLETEVSLLVDGQLVERGLIRVNEPLRYQGVSIYQIASDYHDDGRWSVGFQLSKDPGEGLVWGGAILLVCGLLMAFTWRFRAVALVPDDSGWQLVALAGYSGSAGQRALGALERCLTA